MKDINSGTVFTSFCERETMAVTLQACQWEIWQPPDAMFIS
jgi:hypothetical protein